VTIFDLKEDDNILLQVLSPEQVHGLNRVYGASRTPAKEFSSPAIQLQPMYLRSTAAQCCQTCPKYDVTTLLPSSVPKAPKQGQNRAEHAPPKKK